MAVVSVTSPNSNTRIYSNSDESTFTKTGGTLSWRNNNPGNLIYGTFATSHGAIGEDPNGFAIFPTEEYGYIALVALIANTYGGVSIDTMMEAYAPSFENDTSAYDAFLTSQVGVSGGTIISSLSDSQFNALINGIVTFEGSTSGTLTGTPSTGLSSESNAWLETTSTGNPIISQGYYVPLPADGSTTASIASSIVGQSLNEVSISAATLEQVNAPFSDVSFSTGGLVHIPLSEVSLSSTSTSLPTLFGDVTYVLDPSSSAAYVVGSSLDGHDAGALIIDNDESLSGFFTTFAPGTYSGASVSSGDASITLATPSGFVLGTYDADPSLTLADNTVITLSTTPGFDLTDSLGSSATPENVLLSYLSQLGDTTTASALDTANFNSRNPTGSSPTLTGTITGSIDTFTYDDGAPEAVINGESGYTNYLFATGDLTRVSIYNIQELGTYFYTPYEDGDGGYYSAGGSVTLTSAEWDNIPTIFGADGSLTIDSSGTYSLAGDNIGGIILDFTAGDWGGTTLIGNSTAGQTLTASLFGNDTLDAGNGAGDTLVAGAGVDTLTGGATSNDTFDIGAGVADGTTVTGGTGSNTLQVSASDISGIGVSNVATLDDESGTLTLTASQFSEFTTLEGSGTLIILGNGTYSLSGKTVTGSFTVETTPNLITGTSTNGQVLYANSTGDDVVVAGSGTGDYLYAGSGNDTLIAGNGGDALYAGSGTDILTGGSGGSLGGDFLEAGTGLDFMTGGSGSNWFGVYNSLMAGSVLNGGSAHDSMLQTGGGADVNIAAAAVTNFSGLDVDAEITLTASQLGEFSYIGSDYSTGGTIQAATTGTYSLSENDDAESIDVAQPMTLIAAASGGSTLIAGGNTETLDTSAAGGDIVYGNSGDTVSIASNGQWGADNYVTMSGGTITVADNAHVDIYGGGDTVTAGDYDTIGVQGGDSNNVTVTGGNGSVYVNSGYSDEITADDETVYASADVTLTVTGGGDLIDGTAGDTVDIAGNGEWGTDNYVVMSGGTLDVAASAHADIYGGSTYDISVGNGATLGVQDGNNTIILGSDDNLYINADTSDTINGGGSDGYNFASTFGADTINNDDGSTPSSVVAFASGVTDQDLWFQVSGSALLIDLLGTTDQITLNNWTSGGGNQVASFAAGGSTADAQSMQFGALVSAMATYAAAHSGFNPQAAATTMPTTLNSDIAAAW